MFERMCALQCVQLRRGHHGTLKLGPTCQLGRATGDRHCSHARSDYSILQLDIIIRHGMVTDCGKLGSNGLSMLVFYETHLDKRVLVMSAHNIALPTSTSPSSSP